MRQGRGGDRHQPHGGPGDQRGFHSFTPGLSFQQLTRASGGPRGPASSPAASGALIIDPHRITQAQGMGAALLPTPAPPREGGDERICRPLPVANSRDTVTARGSGRGQLSGATGGSSPGHGHRSHRRASRPRVRPGARGGVAPGEGRLLHRLRADPVDDLRQPGHRHRPLSGGEHQSRPQAQRHRAQPAGGRLLRAVLHPHRPADRLVHRPLQPPVAAGHRHRHLEPGHRPLRGGRRTSPSCSCRASWWARARR